MRRERRPSSWLRGLLLFLLGGLVGANATYFLMSRDAAPGAGTGASERVEVPLPATPTPGTEANPQAADPQRQNIRPMLPPPAVRATGVGPAMTPAVGGDALLIPVRGATTGHLHRCA